MSSYNNLLKVFRKSILEEAGLQEDARGDEFAFKSWLFDYKDSIVSYENGVLDLGYRSFVLEDSSIEILPKDLKAIAAHSIRITNCNIKELKNLIIYSWIVEVENCNNLTDVDIVVKEILHNGMYNGEFPIVSITKCDSLKNVSIKKDRARDTSEIDLFDNPKLTNVSDLDCISLNITNTNITDLSKNNKFETLAVEDDKQINIPFECERIDMKDKYAQPLSIYFDWDYPAIKKEKNRVFYNGLKGKSEEDIFNAVCQKQKITINGNTATGNLEIRNDLLKEIPNNLTNINGSLTIDNCSWSLLPDNLTVSGTLTISNCPNMKQLPNNLKVKSLTLENTPVESLPKDLNITFILELDNVNISALPENLDVKIIKLKDCKNIHNITNTIKFNGLTINNLPLDELPNFEQEYKITNMDFSKFSYIPKSCKIGSIVYGKSLMNSPILLDNIVIKDSNVKNIYNNIECCHFEVNNCNDLSEINSKEIRVTESIKILNCKNLTAINSKIKYEDNYYITISNCPNLKTFPDIFKFGYQLPGYFDKDGKPVIPPDEIAYPNGRFVGTFELHSKGYFTKDEICHDYGDVVIENTPIETLPKCTCRTLKISNTNITKLPEGLVVHNELDICDADIQELPKSLKSCRLIKGFQGNKNKYPDYDFYEEPFSAEDDI